MNPTTSTGTSTGTSGVDDVVATAAVAYTRRGWHVFVLGPSKRPTANCRPCAAAGFDHDGAACPCLTCHGHLAATLDPTRVAAMRQAIPGGLLAIRAGAVSALVVVDIDPRNGGHLDRELFTPTATVSTPGGGWHLYYHHPGHTIGSRPLPGRGGVDIKADGGYVVAPPSHPRGQARGYRWVDTRPLAPVPHRLHALLTTTAPTPTTTGHCRPATRTAGGGIGHPEGYLAACLTAVEHAPVGSRRVTLYGAARGLARLVAAGHLTAGQAWRELERVGQAAEQSPRDIHRAIADAFHAEGVPPC